MSYAFSPQPERVPLEMDASNVIRIAGTRVSLESVLYQYKQGASAEGIALSFPTLSLGDVYTVIAYYLHHTKECEAYLEDVERQEDQLRQELEMKHPTTDIRVRLQERWERLQQERRRVA
jgi:uncharacterized protein (DUF433 family)